MNNATGSMDMSLSGTQETIIEADAKTGLLQKMMAQIKGEGTATSAMGGMEIPVTLNQTITYELITD